MGRTAETWASGGQREGDAIPVFAGAVADDPVVGDINGAGLGAEASVIGGAPGGAGRGVGHAQFERSGVGGTDAERSSLLATALRGAAPDLVELGLDRGDLGGEGGALQLERLLVTGEPREILGLEGEQPLPLVEGRPGRG
jgi:hypothetical protein